MTDSQLPPSDDPGASTPPPTAPTGPGYGTPPDGPGYGQPPPPPPFPGQGTPDGYSVGNAFSYGWAKFQKNAGPILIAAIILFAAVALIQVISGIITSGMTSAGSVLGTYNPSTGRYEGGTTSAGFFGASLFVSLLFSLFSVVVSLVVQAAITRGALNITYGRQVDLKEMFTNINWGQVILGSILVAIATTIGFVLCILPGFVVIFFTWFWLYFVIDKNMPAIDAIKASVQLVKNNAGILIVFFLASVAAYIVGAIACLVGLIVAIPVVVIAQAYTYRTLLGETVAP